jgi:CheY-like chemotaxis protein
MTNAQKRRTLRILCAEDHELICELLGKALSDAGHQVECVLDGQAAWERLCTEPTAFDVLITDHQMPKLTGLALVEKVRTTTFAGRIVVESGNLTPELEAAYWALGVHRIVRKVTRPDFIANLVAELR